MYQPLRLEIGKLDQQLVAAATDCQNTSRRLFVTDQVTKRRFLIDTGSDLCCYPHSWLPYRRQATNYDLSAANGSRIQTFSTINHKLNLGLRRDFAWQFVIADVSTAIIGSDFLAYYHLLPDCRNNKLVDGTTGLTSTASVAIIDQPSIRAVVSGMSIFTELLSEFPDIARPPSEGH